MNRLDVMRALGLGLALLWTVPAHADVETDYERAREAYRQKNEAALLQLQTELADTPLASYPRAWRLSLFLARDPEAADPAIRSFLASTDAGPVPEKLRLDWLKSLGQRGQWEAVLEAARNLGEPDDEAGCHVLHARYQRQEDPTVLNRLAKVFWFQSKPSPSACYPVFNALFRQQLLSRNEVWTRIHMLWRAGYHDEVRYLNRIFPSGQGLPSLWISEAQLKPQSLLNEALANAKTRGEREALALAIERLAQSDASQAASWLQRARETLGPDLEASTWGWVAMQAAKRLQPEALLWFRHGQVERYSDEQLGWMVRAALRQQQWPTVKQAILAMSLAEQSQPAWRYWLARANAVQGEAHEAQRLWSALSGEHHFYGILAREELGQVLDPMAERYRAGEDDMNEARALPGVTRALALYKISARSEAVREWNWAMRGLDDRLLLAAAELARQAKWYDRAIYSADRTLRMHDFALRYVSPYRDTTRVYAKELHLDEAWVFGLMRQESRFVVVARSGVGAQGLMQLMPATAAWVARKIGLRGFHPSMANEVGINVQLGTNYLQQILDQLGGQPVLATAAYNAGPGRARAWQAREKLEAAVYIENIPFEETRDYVKKVMANAHYYAYALGTAPQPLHQRLGVVPGR